MLVRVFPRAGVVHVVVIVVGEDGVNTSQGVGPVIKRHWFQFSKVTLRHADVITVHNLLLDWTKFGVGVGKLLAFPQQRVAIVVGVVVIVVVGRGGPAFDKCCGGCHRLEHACVGSP